MSEAMPIVNLFLEKKRGMMMRLRPQVKKHFRLRQTRSKSAEQKDREDNDFFRRELEKRGSLLSFLSIDMLIAIKPTTSNHHSRAT